MPSQLKSTGSALTGRRFKVDEPLFPVVQLKFGTADFVLTVPPSNLIEFIHVSRLTADRVTFIFVDPTYGAIDAQVFGADKNKSPILYRWGYPGNGLEDSLWNKMLIMNYIPTISHRGIRIHMEGSAVGSEFATIAEPKTYSGKISSVITEIAKEMGYSSDKIFVEETDDDSSDQAPKTEWPTNNGTRIDLIQEMLSIAHSKFNSHRTYLFRLGSDSTFHFHTEEPMSDREAKSSKDKIKYRRFNVLMGVPGGGIEFTPRYSSKTLGNLAQQTVASTYDPRTKRFVQRVIDRDTIGMSGKNDPPKGRTSGAPLNKNVASSEQRKKSNSYVYCETKQVAMGGRCSGKTVREHRGPETALVTVETAWKTMQRAIASAELELVGLPEYANLTMKDMFYDVVVTLPPSSEYTVNGKTTHQDSKLHWSSGRYQVGEVTHHISSAYRISVELKRYMHLEGPSDAKTGAPKKFDAQLVSVR